MGVRTIFYTERITENIDKRVVKPLMTLIGTEYTNDVKQRMVNSPRSGRTYKRGTRTHKASAPGEPPAPDTGDLLKSVRFRLRREGNSWVLEAGSTRKKALYLEFGAARLTKPAGLVRRSKRQTGAEAKWILFPRPAWGPAMQALRLRIPELVARASTLRGK